MGGVVAQLRASTTGYIPRKLAIVATYLSRKLSTFISGSFDKGRAGNGYWLAIGVTLWGMRKMVRMFRRVDEVVYSEKLAPGESLTVRHLYEDFLSVE